MKSKENIVFLGMMGSGKSSLGSLISKELNFHFYDTDKIIEKKLNQKITKIFQYKGEKFFREYEEKITLQILKNKKCVIALGGGTFLNKNVREEILKNHNSFWLKWDPETILKRLKNNSKRPVAINLTSFELMKLIKKRSTIYSKALYSINCDGLSKKQIVNKVKKIYETNKINC